METVEGLLNTLAESWANIPALPDLDLPAPPDPPLLVAIAAIVLGLGIMGVLTGWVEKRLSVVSLASAIFGVALLVWVWEADRDDFGWLTVPEAFIELVARILR